MRTIMLVMFLAASFPSPGDTPPPKTDFAASSEPNKTLLSDMMNATGQVIEKYGEAIRVAISLRECNLGALAAAIIPTKVQINDVTAQYMAKQQAEPAMTLDVMAGVSSSVSFYEMGFKESAPVVHRILKGALCKSAITDANNILAARAGKK